MELSKGNKALIQTADRPLHWWLQNMHLKSMPRRRYIIGAGKRCFCCSAHGLEKRRSFLRNRWEGSSHFPEAGPVEHCCRFPHARAWKPEKAWILKSHWELQRWRIDSEWIIPLFRHCSNIPNSSSVAVWNTWTCQRCSSYLTVNLCPSVFPGFPYCALEETPCQSAARPAEEQDEIRRRKNKRKQRTRVKNRTECTQQEKKTTK